jgi:hypothetical protein
MDGATTFFALECFVEKSIATVAGIDSIMEYFFGDQLDLAAIFSDLNQFGVNFAKLHF